MAVKTQIISFVPLDFSHTFQNLLTFKDIVSRRNSSGNFFLFSAGLDFAIGFSKKGYKTRYINCHDLVDMFVY